jgi:protein-disulfide isomerase
MNEQVRNTFLAVSVGLIAGIGLLVGIGSVVTNSLVPLTARGQSLAESQSRLERELTQKIDALGSKVDSLQNKIDGVDRKMASARSPNGQMPSMPSMPQQPPPEDNTVYDVPVGDSYIMGNPNAPVMIAEFSDLQCPFCSRFHGPLLEAAKAYPNDVKLVFKNFPLPMHSNARPAAKAALAAGLQGKFYEMVAALLQNQGSLTADKFKEVAGQLGLNVDQFVKDLKDRDAEFEKKIQADMDLGGQVNVNGTPTYFVNGKITHGLPVEIWKSKIEAALKDARAGKK